MMMIMMMMVIGVFSPVNRYRDYIWAEGDFQKEIYSGKDQ